MADSEARQRHRHNYERFEARIEVPMMVLSLLIIPVVLMPITEDLSPGSARALETIGFVIWAAFVIEYGLLLIFASNRWQAFRSHKLDLLMVMLPMLRPLRIVQVVRLAQAGVGYGRFRHAARSLGLRPGFAPTLITVGALIVMGAGLVAIAEHGQPGSSIANFGDGLWWALVTCTTVGYGDEYPVTPTGRFIAVLLMLAGISALSIITANISAYFVQLERERGRTGQATDTGSEERSTEDRLGRIEAQLSELNRRLAALVDDGAGPLRSSGDGRGSGPGTQPGS